MADSKVRTMDDFETMKKQQEIAFRECNIPLPGFEEAPVKQEETQSNFGPSEEDQSRNKVNTLPSSLPMTFQSQPQKSDEILIASERAPKVSVIPKFSKVKNVYDTSPKRSMNPVPIPPIYSNTEG